MSRRAGALPLLLLLASLLGQQTAGQALQGIGPTAEQGWTSSSACWLELGVGGAGGGDEAAAQQAQAVSRAAIALFTSIQPLGHWECSPGHASTSFTVHCVVPVRWVACDDQANARVREWRVGPKLRSSKRDSHERATAAIARRVPASSSDNPIIPHLCI